MDGLLRDLVLIFLAAGLVLTLFNRVGLPMIVGLLVTGVGIGPHGLGIVNEPGQVELMADIGIMLLMFSIGLDFTPDRIRELVSTAKLGVFQMLFCIAVVSVAGVLFLDRWAEAVFLGFLVAHTSSTLMMKLFIERGEIRTPQLRLGLGISITQDLSVVPMLLVVPMMAKGEWAAAPIGLEVLRAGVSILVALALGRWVVPVCMHSVMKARSRELHLIFLFVICLGTAWGATAVGLPVSLGAFLAGLSIAGTQYSNQTLAEVVPFRDLLVSLLFISIGMLLDIGGVWGIALPAAGMVAGVLAVKFLSGFVPTLLWGSPLRIATVVGLAMAQIGEFSFVLMHVGRDQGLLSETLFQLFLLVAIVTMLLNPFLVSAGGRVTGWLAAVPLLGRMDGRAMVEGQRPGTELENHVVICGFGLNGRNMVRALQSLGMPYTALELNPESVRAAQQRGESVHFGDATRVEILQSVRIEAARVYVVAISDASATRQTVQLARRLNPGLEIIVRTRNLEEIGPLRELGADQVIAEEFETSLEILAQTLHSYHLPRQNIEMMLQGFRGNAYQALRGPAALTAGRTMLADMLPTIEIESVSIGADSPAADRTLAELNLRARTGTTVLGVHRERQMTTIPPADFVIEAGDVLVLGGTPRQILDALGTLAPRGEGSDAAERAGPERSAGRAEG